VAGGVVHLLGQFQVSHLGVPVELPASTHRLVAFLALQGHRVERSYAASCLWLDKSGDRAGANLRSTLWRLRRCPMQLVTATAGHVGLREDVAVDTAVLLRCARDLVDERRVVDLDAVEIADLSVDLLPSWYDDFVEVERERFRQLRLHALEALSRRLRAEGRHARALDAALAAVSADPLRESAHRAVIQVHLDEGNTAEAVRQYRLLSEVLRVHLGIEPSRRSRELIGEQLRDGDLGPPVRYSAEPGYRPADLRDSPRAQPRRPRIALA
jgi:DNA-binding SARP family transcriptional activator